VSQITIGLSGHIDHGKTSIVKSLTGKNTDSLKDEIKRGMTIDIGFAHLNDKISLIDVPGHEKFIKNMVAGVSAIDSVILVIAADDGIMPQTREHFQILKLLGIKSGIIVVNKIDLVDSEWLDLVELEIKDFVEDTFLSSANIIKVSTITNIGINDLKEEIIKISNLKKDKFNRNIFRMFIDRVFIKKGFGTVVTGTVASGKTYKGKELQILPSYEKVNIRGIQSHDNSTDELSIGDRAAINLQTTHKVNLKRGYHIGKVGYFNLVHNAICSVITFVNLKHNQRIRIHLGTQEVMARVFFTDNNIKKNMIALLKFESPIVAAFKDKFIVRTYSPLHTIGGGEIIDINTSGKWNENKIYLDNFIGNLNDSQIIEKIIERDNKLIFKKSKLYQHLGLSEIAVDELLDKIDNLRYYSKDDYWIITIKQYTLLTKRIIDLLSILHDKNPYNKGFLLDEINNNILLPDDLLKYILIDCCKEKKIKVDDVLYSKYDFKINLSDKESLTKEKLVKIINETMFQTPSIESLSNQLNLDINNIKKLLHIEKSNNNIIIINGEIIVSINNYNSLLENLRIYFKSNDLLDIKEFKKMTNTTRKYAVPLLEYLDKQKITFRIGNERKYNKK
jgi:selenocysteine-specific elongation factor